MSQNKTRIIFFAVFTILLLLPIRITLGDKNGISIDPNDEFKYVIGKKNTFLGTIKITTSENLAFSFTLTNQTGSEIVNRRSVNSILFHFIGVGNYTILIKNQEAKTISITLIVEAEDLIKESSEKYTTENNSVCWQITANNDDYIISLESLTYGDYDAYIDFIGGFGIVKVYVALADPEVVEDWKIYSDTYTVTTGTFLRKFTIDDDSKYWLCIRSDDENSHQVTLTFILTGLKRDNGTIFILAVAAFIAAITLYLNSKKRKRSLRNSAMALKAKKEATEEFKSIRLQSVEYQYSNIKFKK
ncbi:MAG: hypothetical protein K9W45_00155 [Candidatus Heimdallarchaeum aukensis]|uniref:Uncharacterized protein n=1 Tax=Candidatus Heimdallarchaeum aukensis TaxID=2876573 RepID=A0A9Y1FL25_9ARCH|nr:MAG: hypothetical protein K9W45_00155 [Candidatus Heimdallarchaeum aukensis]